VPVDLCDLANDLDLSFDFLGLLLDFLLFCEMIPGSNESFRRLKDPSFDCLFKALFSCSLSFFLRGARSGS